jgi:capsular polysaccharide biosynthesis protein
MQIKSLLKKLFGNNSESGNYQYFDELIYSARVNYQWRDLELAIQEIAKIEIGDSHLGRYSIDICIHGWSKDFRFLKNVLSSLQVNYQFTFKIERKVRKDVKKSEGILFLFSGYVIKVKVKLTDHSYIDLSKKLTSAISISLDYKSRQKIRNEPHSGPHGYVDFTSLQIVNSELSQVSVVGYLIENPRNAMYLLEAINDKKLTQKILAFIHEIGIDSFFLDIGIQKQVLTKLMLICNSDSPISELTKYDIHFVKLDEVNVFSDSSLEFHLTNAGPGAVIFDPHSSNLTLQPTFGQLTDVAVRGNGRILNLKSLFIHDRSDDPRLSDVAGNQLIEFGSITNLNCAYAEPLLIGESIQEGIHLISRANENWFHWLIETLPRVLLLPEELNAKIPLIISSKLSSTALESLSLITEKKFIQVKANSNLAVSRLYLPGPVVYHPDSSEMNWDKRTVVNQAVLKSLRQLVLTKLHTEPEKRYKIFFSRHSPHRKLINIKQIEKIMFKEYNFKIVNPDHLNFAEQVKLFSQAETVITPGGASMSNFIFLPEGAMAVVLVSELLNDYTMPAVLASVSNARCNAVLGKHLKNSNPVLSRHDLFHSDYYVDPNQLRDQLNYIMEK